MLCSWKCSAAGNALQKSCSVQDLQYTDGVLQSMWCVTIYEVYCLECIAVGARSLIYGATFLGGSIARAALRDQSTLQHFHR